MAGKIVVVTGGIRNLGKEISLRLAAENATVVAASRHPKVSGASPEEAQKARSEMSAADSALAAMRRAGGRTLWIDSDISRPQKVRALIEETRNRFGRIDAFVNNAGAGGDFSMVTEVLREHRTSWESVLRSNFLGPWTAAGILRDIMKNQPEGGAIVNVSTHYADHPYLFRTIYTVSKILLKALTLALQKRLSGENIMIADVAPSLIAGPRMDWVMKNYAGKFAERLGALPDLRGAESNSLQERFIRCFDRSIPTHAREAAAKSFIDGIRESSLQKGRREELESWFARIKDWFAATVPDVPPANEQVADSVIHAVKNGRFLENRFIGVSSLGSFSTFPPAQPARKEKI
jgi:NAD(P)-dependent dehydrogenase (short-subunit alcohol dehydrogenase family)